MSGQEPARRVFGDPASLTATLVRPSTFLPERAPSGNSSSAEQLVTSLCNTIEQYSSGVNEINESTKELRTVIEHQLNSGIQQVSDTAQQLRQEITQLNNQLQQLSSSTDQLRTENKDLRNLLQESSQAVDQLRVVNFALRARLQEASHPATSTSTAPKRTSLTAFSPERPLAKKAAVGHRQTRARDSGASIDSDGTQPDSPIDVPFKSQPSVRNPAPLPSIRPSPPQASVRIPPPQLPGRAPPQPQSVTGAVSVSYPKDPATIGCLRIDVLAVSEGKWAADVSNDLQEMIKDYLKWAASRTKNFAVPKYSWIDLSAVQCHWHEISRNDSYGPCIWHENGEGAEDWYHACTACETRGELCCMLESKNVLVLLPLLPSSRRDKRPNLGPHDRSYWVNGD